jgi:hypothetical protein
MDHYSIYAKKLASLRKELSEIRKNLRKKKKDFNENQQKMYDFINGKRNIAQFGIKGSQYFLKKGNEEKGFMHILLRHYGEGCKEGCLSARNILNIATTIKMGSPYQSEKNDYLTISNTFEHGRFIVVLSKDRNGHWIVSYYKVEE